MAKAQGLSESALLRRLLENIVVPAREPDDMVITPGAAVHSSRFGSAASGRLASSTRAGQGS